MSREIARVVGILTDSLRRLRRSPLPSLLLILALSAPVAIAAPDEVRAFLRDVPTVWDDTVLLDGSPDSHVAIARQSESGWWIGAINGSDEPVAIDLSVVGHLDVGDGASTVDLVCDGVNPEVDPFTFGTISLDELELLRLPPFGGCVAHPSS